MASLIQGFEYDIFISYRQKDNKGDRWVSEFVEALKTELASTFKEKVSIYFDVNPHDGLLETHDVDASLKEKLKCLVFIPVLSRTFCDPKSFAWKNEFEAFIEQASQDQFGLKVKLSNGNMTSRILPVRIHDLDPEDIRLLETQIDLIHPVDFIYYSQGVNRPLRKQDDMVHDQKQLIYIDQINKTALAVKEIIVGLKGEKDVSVARGSEYREKERDFYEDRKPSKSAKSKLFAGAGFLLIFMFIGLFIYPGIIGRNDLGRLISKDGRIPVAVMPFQNMTNDTLLDIWQDGIQNILINNLSNTEELKIRQESINKLLKTSGITDYASLTPSVAGSISRKLEANVHITGSVKQSGSTIRLNAQLVNSKTGEAFKSFQINGIADSIFPMIDSLSLMFRNFLLISVMKKVQPPFYHEYKVLTNSPEAYRYYLNGNKAFDKINLDEAQDWYLQAIATDSNFCSPIIKLAAVYYNQGLFAEGKKWCLKAYKRRDQVPLRVLLIINSVYAMFFETIHETIKYEKQIKELDDKNPDFYYELGVDYWIISEYDKAINEFKQGLEIYKEWGMKPDWVNAYTVLGEVYIKTNQLKKLTKLIKKMEQDFPKDPDACGFQAVLYLKQRDTIRANQKIEQHTSMIEDYYTGHNSYSQASLMMLRANIYNMADMPDKAEPYYRKALALEPENRGRMRDLAYLLIDKDLNISEGLELIEKVLEASPDAFRSLDCKGWGLYKQGKYKEALETLQKSWDLRIQNAVYDHTAYLHLEAAKKAVTAIN